jgi:hypothetical protein
MKRIIAAALVACIAVPAMAQQRNCGPREKIVERLAEKYQETRQAIGLGMNNSVLEVFANTETGSWTIIASSPSGISCVAAAGGEFALSATAPEPAGVRL